MTRSFGVTKSNESCAREIIVWDCRRASCDFSRPEAYP